MIIFYVLLGLALILFCVWQNKSIVTTYDTYYSDRLPAVFEGLNIGLISDFHNAYYGANQRYILDKISAANVDLLFVTGDIVDRYRTNITRTIHFMRGLTKIAPVYYVPGNHEARLDDYISFSKALTDIGVIVLDNALARFTQGDAALDIIGINDPIFYEIPYDAMPAYYNDTLTDLKKEPPNSLCLLLVHRPEFLDIYAKNHIPLVFAGHAHGGQIRLPLIGGLYAPHQGLFPKYTGGLYTKHDTTMLVSRGLGNSGYALLRFFNRPHFAVLTLHHK